MKLHVIIGFGHFPILFQTFPKHSFFLFFTPFVCLFKNKIKVFN